MFSGGYRKRPVVWNGLRRFKSGQYITGKVKVPEDMVATSGGGVHEKVK